MADVPHPLRQTERRPGIPEDWFRIPASVLVHLGGEICPVSARGLKPFLYRAVNAALKGRSSTVVCFTVACLLKALASLRGTADGGCPHIVLISFLCSTCCSRLWWVQRLGLRWHRSARGAGRRA